ncbi:hypothetical protein [Brachybacterium sp.]|jgi:hypothetical protein|uniref:hypothetical protein n=1 Tax=Brachybacterium sp. TaxID=1891286 RepID=UPI002ED39733
MGVRIDTGSSAGLDVAIATEEALTDRDRRLLRSLVKEMKSDEEERRDDGPSSDRGARVPSGPQSDGATIHELRARPWCEEDDVAADTGVHELDIEDAKAAERGEGAQDPDDYR